MIEKRLGKIDFVEFGSMKDYPFQLGLQLGFSMSGSGVMDGGKAARNDAIGAGIVEGAQGRGGHQAISPRQACSRVATS